MTGPTLQNKYAFCCFVALNSLSRMRRSMVSYRLPTRSWRIVVATKWSWWRDIQLVYSSKKSALATDSISDVVKWLVQDKTKRGKADVSSNKPSFLAHSYTVKSTGPCSCTRRIRQSAHTKWSISFTNKSTGSLSLYAFRNSDGKGL